MGQEAQQHSALQLALQRAINGPIDFLRGGLGDVGESIENKAGQLVTAGLPFVMGPLRQAELLKKFGGGRENAMVEQAIQALKSSPGATIAGNGRNLAGSGEFAVAMFPELSRRIQGRVSPDALRQFIREHEALLARPGHNLGIWDDAGESWLDISGTFKDRGTAEGVGRLMNQKAIGWLKDPYEDILIGGTGTAPASLPPQDARMEALIRAIKGQ